MKSYSSREIIKILHKNGWKLVRTVGDHCQFKKDNKLTTITHPVKDVKINDIKSIQRQTGIKF